VKARSLHVPLPCLFDRRLVQELNGASQRQLFAQHILFVDHWSIKATITSVGGRTPPGRKHGRLPQDLIGALQLAILALELRQLCRSSMVRPARCPAPPGGRPCSGHSGPPGRRRQGLAGSCACIDVHLIHGRLRFSTAIRTVRKARFHVHCTLTFGSWLSLLERWFVELTNKPLRRGLQQSVGSSNPASRSHRRVSAERPGRSRG